MMIQALSIRTKLIVAMLALVASVATMGMTADSAHAGVTEIRNVINNTFTYTYPNSGKTVYVWNHENGKFVTVAPASYYGDLPQVAFNQWVPWCTNSSAFNAGHYIEIGYMEDGQRVHKYSIWQENKNGQDRIRYTKARSYDPYAQAMPGDSMVDGRRDLRVFNLDAAATTSGTGARLYKYY